MSIRDQFNFMRPIKGWKIYQGPEIEPGIYDGHWSGYQLKIFASERHLYIAETVIGVRGMNVPCTVVVEDDGSTYFKEKVDDEFANVER